ncbi:hypothetical protein NC652_038453 [Populus alba x Populus x berolinensis]|nr:hypothetical protein NC652_038453 [Populus alba x Populus x berolinensis]
MNLLEGWKKGQKLPGLRASSGAAAAPTSFGPVFEVGKTKLLLLSPGTITISAAVSLKTSATGAFMSVLVQSSRRWRRSWFMGLRSYRTAVVLEKFTAAATVFRSVQGSYV